MDSKYQIVDLKWDTEYFGVNSARVNIFKQLNENEIEKIISDTKKYQFVTIYNYNNNDYNNFLFHKMNNIFLSDINVHLEKNTKNIETDNSSIIIDNNLLKNDNLLNIAKDSFIYSRFINDKNLEQEKAKLLYYNWVNNSFNNKNKYFCIYKNRGFLLFNIDFETKTASIELIAVKKDNENKGIGSILIKSFEKYCYENRIEKIEVGTQLNNIKAQRFYQKNGFIITQYNSIYHLWN